MKIIGTYEDRLDAAGILVDARKLCAQFGVTLDDACSRARSRPVVRARHALWQYLHDELEWSYSYIGQVFGVHHTTVMAALK